MPNDSHIYQNAFSHYLRSGVRVGTYHAVAQEKALDEVRHSAAKLARAIIACRIDELRQKFSQRNRRFPDRTLPDMAKFEKEFAQRYIALRLVLQDCQAKGAPISEREAAEEFLQDWFAQVTDTILQPLYGVESFLWVSTSSRPCFNCANNDGKVFRWDEGIHPPGCGRCRCIAQPIIEPGAQADESMAPAPQELLSYTWRLGSHKGDIKWTNRLRDRGWTKAKITETIKNGTPYPAPNRPNKQNTATRYELNSSYVVVDYMTKEILQVSAKRIIIDKLP